MVNHSLFYQCKQKYPLLWNHELEFSKVLRHNFQSENSSSHFVFYLVYSFSGIHLGW